MKFYMTIIIIVLALACSSNKVPKGILTEKEITPVLVELHLAEAIFAQRFAQEVTRENYQEDLYLSILKKYKIDQKTFEASVLYYGKNPILYKPIYDEVLNRLNEMSTKSRAKDSIQTSRISAKSRTNDSIQTSQRNAKAKDSIQSTKMNKKTKKKDTIQTIK